MNPLLTRALAAKAPDRTQARILDAALAEFEEYGLRRVSMEDVARRAGVHRVTIYRRFEGKNALVEAVILRELQRFMHDFGQALRTVHGLPDQIAEGFVFTLRFFRENQLLTRLLATEPETLLPHVTLQAGPLLAAATQFLADQLRAAPDAPSWMAEHADAVAETEIRLVLTFILTPASTIPLATDDQMRTYARRHITPLVTGQIP